MSVILRRPVCGEPVRLPYVAGPRRGSTDTGWSNPVCVGPCVSRACVYALDTPPPPLVPAMPLGKLVAGGGVVAPRSPEPPHRPPVLREGEETRGSLVGWPCSRGSPRAQTR